MWIIFCLLNYWRKKWKDKFFVGILICEFRLIFDVVLFCDNYFVVFSKLKKRCSLYYIVELVVVISFNINY